YPDLLCRPLPGPFDRHVVVVRGRYGIRVRLELEEGVDPERVLAQETDPLAVREVELCSRLAGPLDAVHPELRALQLLRQRADGRRRQVREHRVREEDEASTGPEQARGL